MAREVLTREQIELPYRHPYRYWMPHAWRLCAGNYTAATGGTIAGALATAGVVMDATPAVGMAAAILAATLGVLGYWMGKGALIVWRRSSGWDRPSELGRVRAQRPHASERDPEVSHDEFAVTVEESGELWIWRFRPLPIHEPEDPGEVLVPGRPEHTAVVMEHMPFDPRDAGRAAEQLAEAQSRAADLERNAARAAVRRLSAQREALELEAEAKSTAAALQHLTGQQRRP